MEYSFSKGKMTLKDVLMKFHTEGELEYAYESEINPNNICREDSGWNYLYKANINLNNPISFPQIKSLEQHYTLNLIQNEKYSQDKFQEGQEHEYEGYKYNSYNRIHREIDNKQTSSEKDNTNESTEAFTGKGSKIDDNKWKNFFTSPLQVASLRGKHQRDTAKQIYLNFTTNNRRATLLEGGAGNGKTFVAAAVVRKLIDENFFKDCRSPWPVLWITRASILEQTSRVCRELFGLSPTDDCIVINVEQLRAKFGEYMVDCSTIVRGGEEHIIWQWRPKFHPMMFIIDECQFAKNDDSTQAKIVAAISEIEDLVRILAMSATPFTRVSEARYFITNCHMEISV